MTVTVTVTMTVTVTLFFSTLGENLDLDWGCWELRTGFWRQGPRSRGFAHSQPLISQTTSCTSCNTL